MIEIILFFLIAFLVLVFFYKQVSTEFTILQIEGDKLDSLSDPLSENSPVVIRGLGQPKVLTLDILKSTPRIQTLPVGTGVTLASYLESPKGQSITVLPPDLRRNLANELGLQIWAEHVWFQRIKEEYIYGSLMSLSTEAYLSSAGMRQTIAAHTLLFPTNGTFTCSIFMSASTKFLPKGWEGLFLTDLSPSQCPLLSEVQYMDIVLRPGHMLIVPPHWIVSMKCQDEVPAFAWIEVHHPISSLAAALA